MRIAGSVAVVTGASSGIGRAIAIDLAERGATVVAAARRREQVEEVAEACRKRSPESFAVVCDVSVHADCEQLAAAVQERLGRCDILVNNAGISIHKDLLVTLIDDVERVMRTNFLGAVDLAMLVLPGMVERGRGFIVNVGSVAGDVPSPKETAYGASKAALHMWTHTIGVDLAGTGVHAGVLSPGPIDTEIWDKDETPSSFNGRKYPPEVVAVACARMIEKELVHLTVPRQFGIVGPLYGLPVVRRAMRMGLVKFEAAGQRRMGSEGAGRR